MLYGLCCHQLCVDGMQAGVDFDWSFVHTSTSHVELCVVIV